MPELVTYFLLDLAVLLSLLVLGGLLVGVILRTPSWFDTASLSFPLGAGAFTWLLFLLSWLGVEISQLTISLLMAGCLTIALLVAWRLESLRWPQASGGDARAERSSLATIAFGVVILLIVVSALLAVGRAYSTWDAVAIWSIKGYGIALEGSIFAANDWGAHGQAYPLNVPLLIALFRLASGDVVPLSKLIFPLFWLSTLIGIYAFWRRSKVQRSMAALGLLFVATIPAIYFHGTIGYANIPLASYIVLGTLWGIEGIREANPRAQTMSGILLGLAVWTRVEGVLFSLAVVAALGGTWIISRNGRPFLRPWLLPLLGFSVIWTVFFVAFGAAGSQPSQATGSAFGSILNGDFNLSGAGIIIRYFIGRTIELQPWGLLFPASALLILLNFRQLYPRKHPEAFSLLFSAALMGVLSLTFFYVGSFGEIPWLYDLLTRSVPRALFQSVFLLGVLAVLLAGYALAKPVRQASEEEEY